MSERPLLPGEAPIRFHYGWLVLAVGTLVVFGALGLARFGYTMLLPPMQASLGLDNTQAGALATANLVGYLALTVIGGALASHYGPRIVITVGLAVAALGMLLTGLADSFGAALGWRALTGIGSGASNVPAMALLSAWFAQRRLGSPPASASRGRRSPSSCWARWSRACWPTSARTAGASPGSALPP